MLLGGLVRGTTPGGLSAKTEKQGGYQLNGNFSLWLMGYPEGWGSCGVQAIRSFRKLRKRS